jgi:endonuclease/exonuclease/phosphatase family metal-dependent hydrolase
VPSFRRGWLVVLLALACGGPMDQGSLYEDLGGTTRLRLVAANLSTGNTQSWTAGEGLRILEGLHPDVVMIQEFNTGSNAAGEIQAFANSVCGQPCAVTREAGALQIPNGIISRYPIKSAGRWADSHVGNRGFAWAQIDIPGSRDLWAISVHLLTSSAANRDAEAAQLVQFIRQNVPAGDSVVLGGDFNTAARTEPALVTLSQVFAIPAAFPSDGSGNDLTNQPRTRPDDWVLASPGLEAAATAVVIGSNSFPAGLVADTRVYAPIADLHPALATDSGASNMQHMAIVRDFLVAQDVGHADGGHADGGGWTPDGGGWTPDGGGWIPDGGGWIPDGGGWTPDGGGWIPDGGSADAGQPDGGPTRDPYEPDDSAAYARPIAPGEQQVHDISPKSDVDFLTFTLPATANVSIETSGPAGGDTLLRLYDRSARQLASDDDSGAGYYSLLRKTLPAGTYLVQVSSYAGASVIRGYTVRVSTF